MVARNQVIQFRDNFTSPRLQNDLRKMCKSEFLKEIVLRGAYLICTILLISIYVKPTAFDVDIRPSYHTFVDLCIN